MPHILHTIGLAAHVADLRKALFDTPSKKRREALTLLCGDSLAQIMSFMPYQEQRRCPSAVSPQMRLDSEMMACESNIWPLEPRVRVCSSPSNSSEVGAGQMLCVSVITSGEDPKRQQTLSSLWWASRCGLPVELSIDNNDREILAYLDGTLRDRATSLTVTMRSPPESAADDAVVSSSTSTATVLTSLLAFPNLQQLAIEDEEHQVKMPMSAEVLGALAAAANLPLTMLELNGCVPVQDLSALTGNQFLRSLCVNHCGLQSLEGIGKYPVLEELVGWDCPHLTSISALAGLSRLQQVFIVRCDLHSLDGLGSCVALKSVNVNGNRNLQSLSPLAGAPLLETIVVSYCDIRSVQGLGSCASLTQIILTANANLLTLGSLSEAPCLQKVIARVCGLRDLGEAGPWSALQEINVSYSRDLQSLSGLSGAPLLEEVYVTNCSIQDFTVLDTCPKLRKVFKTEADYGGGE